MRTESEIFNEYVKIAEQEGFVSEADYAEGRIGSDNKEVIEMLYGVKPNGKEDETHIMDKAHPESPVVIAPAHDKMNSILETEKERQNIMTYIALKMPDGNLTQGRYVTAYNNLMESLVRAGFATDNEEQQDLMKFADSCTERLEKTALAPLVLGLIWAGVAALGTVALVNNTPNLAQSVSNNTEAAIRELEDLREESPGLVNDILPKLRALQEASKAYDTAADRIRSAARSAKDADSLVDLNMSGELASEFRTVDDYSKLVMKWLSDIDGMMKDVQAVAPNKDYQYDWLAKIRWITKAIDPDDVQDAVNALAGLKNSLLEAQQNISAVRAKAEGFRPHIAAATTKKLEESKDLGHESSGGGALGLVKKMLGMRG